jgi:hypothetical protein
LTAKINLLVSLAFDILKDQQLIIHRRLGLPVRVRRPAWIRASASNPARVAIRRDRLMGLHQEGKSPTAKPDLAGCLKSRGNQTAVGSF